MSLHGVIRKMVQLVKLLHQSLIPSTYIKGRLCLQSWAWGVRSPGACWLLSLVELVSLGSLSDPVLKVHVCIKSNYAVWDCNTPCPRSHRLSTKYPSESHGKPSLNCCSGVSTKHQNDRGCWHCVACLPADSKVRLSLEIPHTLDTRLGGVS